MRTCRVKISRDWPRTKRSVGVGWPIFPKGRPPLIRGLLRFSESLCINTMFSNEPGPESLTWLDEKYQSAALDPKTPLRCNEQAGDAEIRDAFRKICIERMQGDWLNVDSLCKKGEMVNWNIALFSYRKYTKAFMAPPSFTGNPIPATLKDISKLLEKSPLLEQKPIDILMVLKPLRSFEMGYFQSVRACGFFTIILMGWETCYDKGLAYTSYIFQVDYCMRRSIVRKRFSEFTAFQEQILKEIHVYPAPPVEHNVLFRFFLGDKFARGSAMANFMYLTHQVLKERGLYSPRLMKFLNINVINVHIEEEARIAQLLDSSSLPPGCQWEIVDEVWLSRWRKFVMSRGARRYQAPGKITNIRLLQFEERELSEKNIESYTQWTHFLGLEAGPNANNKLTKLGKHVPRPHLKQGRNYRSINSNFWTYLHMVYGGGPRISRKDKSVYSPLKLDVMGACILIQRLARRRIARKQFKKLENKHLSSKLEGVRIVLYEKQREEMAVRAKKQKDTIEEIRNRRYLEDAATFTQMAWRKKKKITASNEGLKGLKEAQEIHASADGGIEEAFEGEPLVVEDIKDIIAMPMTEIDEIVFTEAQVNSSS